ncbi:hypothetical protein PSTT_14970 [Puccinia striiformis]|uniref:Uncharacterized protein n=1 Tax=Puccinia striiformis TaxID=27350 RepID=A0A2S4UK24_9BASI|nr:hypothetical protein PSTT_14970 [Puccinia striiformis]
MSNDSYKEDFHDDCTGPFHLFKGKQRAPHNIGFHFVHFLGPTHLQHYKPTLFKPVLRCKLRDADYERIRSDQNFILKTYASNRIVPPGRQSLLGQTGNRSKKSSRNIDLQTSILVLNKRRDRGRTSHEDAGEAGTGAKDVKNAHNLASKPGLQGGRSATSSLEKDARELSSPQSPRGGKPTNPGKNTLPAIAAILHPGLIAPSELVALGPEILQSSSSKTPIAPKPSELKPISTEEVKGGQLQDGKENVESFKGDQSRTDQYKGQKSPAEQSKRAQFKSSQLKAIKEPSAPISDIQGESKSAKRVRELWAKSVDNQQNINPVS